MNLVHWYDFLLRLGVAVGAGALIGVERQWRSRGAGLRTNTLVATGAAMFVLISHMAPAGANPTQVTAYVVSGVGFLGAGVIISDGVSIRGINTAATLWCAAAIGALSASGFVWQAAVATVAVLAINILLRPLGRRIDRQAIDRDSDIETTYRFQATTKDASEAHVRALLLQAISGHGYQLRAIESANLPDSNLVEVRAELVTTGRNDHQIETAAGRLGLEPNVTSVRWQAVETNGQGGLGNHTALE
jgi:putative Mg2+ transporter-C (MgtC) family protein